MPFLNDQKAQQIRNILNIIGVIASIILIVSISLEVFSDDSFFEKDIYSDTQFWVCIYFCIDFFIFWFLSKNRAQFFRRYFMIFFLSVPYLSFIDNLHEHFTEGEIYLIRLIPLVRGAAAFVFIILLFVSRSTTVLFISYIILLIAIIYFMTILFFVAERSVNPEVKTFYDSLWWAAMTVTTLGSTIQPITVSGKVITASLAVVGLTIFPIFTAYLTTLVSRLGQKEHHEASASKNSKSTA
ncbi:ion channel [Ignatzschineria sp. LJL83]